MARIINGDPCELTPWIHVQTTTGIDENNNNVSVERFIHGTDPFLIGDIWGGDPSTLEVYKTVTNQHEEYRGFEWGDILLITEKGCANPEMFRFGSLDELKEEQDGDIWGRVDGTTQMTLQEVILYGQDPQFDTFRAGLFNFGIEGIEGMPDLSDVWNGIPRFLKVIGGVWISWELYKEVSRVEREKKR
jgi:hypothetical protein